ncbi:MAG: DUF499 domain-containing protein [Acidimicrobiales bacterium]|nr:DUF499 domain-containing protein [Acidimicrobiales bacterium]
MANTERIQRALDLLRDGLQPKCEETWRGFYGDEWLEAVNGQLRTPDRSPSPSDVAFLFKGLKATWNEVFRHGFSATDRSLIFELGDVRNTWAHQGSFSTDDTMRALDSMERVLEAFGDLENRKKIQTLRKDLMRQLIDEESRTERRKTAAKPTEGDPQAGLTPWRELVTPHDDVSSGRFNQAEFAADLYEVATGDAEEEYQDPEAFFRRTYLTKGLTDLLVGAATRLSGGGTDPVIELQTNFGGGKTHSMIALYHLASGVPTKSLPGVAEALAEAGVTLPADIRRAVIVGQMTSPETPLEVEPDIRLHTLWGHIAYQLGGRDAYELLRADDEAGTNPGATLKRIFEECGPAIVLIDEWVRYAAQLREAGDGKRLAGGDFDTQFTFAQTLTEAAAAVPDVVVLVAIPASDIEAGGERGRVALERLKAVVTRKATQWQPASPDESFEIVRRRLFDPITPENAKVRDGVIRAFEEMYRRHQGDFPPGTGEADFRRRMELSYPIHPELFDRLFEDWSAVDKFQRTRGVLRLMAIVISQLWQRGDQSLMLMPGNLPMDSAPLVSEMEKYLEQEWDAVIKSNVDGENALPLRLDRDNKHFGKLSAARRVARSVYMGSAPGGDAATAIDVKSIVLGSVQPGEPPKQFQDALHRLANDATHLHNNGTQYWFSLEQTLSRLATDRANSTSDFDADDEVQKRIRSQGDRGNFVEVQVFAEGPGDVPDNDDGTRLVILTPDVAYSGVESPAIELAEQILAQRDGGPRVNRNLLVFVAANHKRLSELRATAKSYLAWRSIAAREGELDLKDSQVTEAEGRLQEASQTLDSLINETFTEVLSPRQAPGTAEINWSTVRATGGGEIAERVSKKLASEELLISGYGGVRVRMDLDNVGLWSERGDIALRDLWAAYCRYPYLTRLASFDVLAGAVSNGTANLNWAEETFAYAEAHDGDSWLGVVRGEHVNATRSGLLVLPEKVPAPPEPEEGDGGTEGDGGGDRSEGGEPPPEPPGKDGERPRTQFYAHFELDSVRAIKDLGQILEHVTDHLGSGVTLSLEVHAVSEAGYDDATRRVVNENANNLGATGAEFE